MAVKKARSAYQLKVTLKGMRPPVWRRVVVPGRFDLEELHWVIQIAMGWTNSHLHQFVFKVPREAPRPSDMSRWMAGEFAIRLSAIRGERVFSDPSFELEDIEDEAKVSLDELSLSERDKFRYEYDFGDGWDHDVLVEKIAPIERSATYPRCLAGRRRCPPEDCGGPWGYGEMLEALGDPAHERHREFVEWIGGDFDPERFDLAAVNAAMAAVTRE
jgi:hypothetical protein